MTCLKCKERHKSIVQGVKAAARMDLEEASKEVRSVKKSMFEDMAAVRDRLRRIRKKRLSKEK